MLKKIKAILKGKWGLVLAYIHLLVLVLALAPLGVGVGGLAGWKDKLLRGVKSYCVSNLWNSLPWDGCDGNWQSPGEEIHQWRLDATAVILLGHMPLLTGCGGGGAMGWTLRDTKLPDLAIWSNPARLFLRPFFGLNCYEWCRLPSPQPVTDLFGC